MEHRSLDFDDDSLLHTLEPVYLPPPTLEIKSHTLYRYDDYLWNGFELDCTVIKLTKGYFTFVEFDDLEKVELLDCLWAQVNRNQETGEISKVRAVGQIGRKKFL